MVRRLIDAASEDVVVPSNRLTEQEALDLLHEAARAGRVSALTEILRREERADPRERAMESFQAMLAERRQ
jgi:hypothetical protein